MQSDTEDNLPPQVITQLIESVMAEDDANDPALDLYQHGRNEP